MSLLGNLGTSLGHLYKATKDNYVEGHKDISLDEFNALKLKSKQDSIANFELAKVYYFGQFQMNQNYKLAIKYFAEYCNMATSKEIEAKRKTKIKELLREKKINDIDKVTLYDHVLEKIAYMAVNPIENPLNLRTE